MNEQTEKLIPVVYIAGPFRAETPYDVVQNIRVAEAAALRVWRAGMVALCPHLNTANFSGAAPDEIWLEGDLEMLKRCDAVLLVGNWSESKGATEEYAQASKLNLPCSSDVARLQQIFRDDPNYRLMR